jgi:glycoside/pentoside/hexuronide:cation symporter, GPH family
MVEATGPLQRPLAEAKAAKVDGTGQAPSIWVKLAYGFGAVAYGVKENGFSYFLMLFYSQVVGLDARLVGLAMTISLIFDAISEAICWPWRSSSASR